MGMTQVLFKNNGECLEKLKELGILSKTKEISDLSTILFKKVNSDNKIKSFSCKVIGFNYKENPDNCINKTYDNLIVEVDNSIFNINPEYLKDMQSKSWGQKEDTNIKDTPSIPHLPISNKMGIFIHLFTKPREGIILEITNAKSTIPDEFLSTAITKGFNKAMNTNLTYEQIKQKHYVNRYSHVRFSDDYETFYLEDNMTTFSLNHKTRNYIFATESLSTAEIDSKNYTRIVSIDFETANSKRASVCSIGFVVEENGEIIKEKEILVNPKTDFTPMSIRVHDIRPLDVVDAPTWDVAWKEVESYITDSTLVIAHNLRSMELACIRQECERYNIELPSFAKLRGHNKMAYDTLKIAKENYPDFQNYKLDTLAKHFNIELDHHNALSDAKACLELFHHLKGDYSTNV